MAAAGLCQPGLASAASKGKAARSHAVFGKLCHQHGSMIFGDLGWSLCTHRFPAMGDVPFQDHCLQVCLLTVLLSTHGAGACTSAGLGQCRREGRVDPWALLAQQIWHGGLALAQQQPPQTCTAALSLCIPVHSRHVFIYRGKTDPTLNWT